MYFFLYSDLLPSSKSEKKDLYLFVLNPDKTGVFQEGHPTDTDKQCQPERRPLSLKGMFGCSVKWANNPGLSKEWASRGLADPKCGQFLEAVIYLQTQVFPFIVNTQSVILARILGHFLYFLLVPCQHATFIFLFAPLLTATQATNTNQRHVWQLWLGLCQNEFSLLVLF